uniref:Uncharacterized protein n=1 Tax=Anguilla anguilla TaxID=7936 RepID=A0A0E9XD08_ANGAN
MRFVKSVLRNCTVLYCGHLQARFCKYCLCIQATPFTL